MRSADVELIESERIRLLAFADCDQALYVGLYTDASVMRHLGSPLAPAAARQAFAAVLRQTSRTPPAARYWRILWRDGGGAEAGLVALVYDKDREGAEIGLLLWPHSQDQGVAREAITLVADRVFAGATPLPCLWTRHGDDNRLAVSLMRRLGFARDGEIATGPQQRPFPRWRVTRDGWQDRSNRFAPSSARC